MQVDYFVGVEAVPETTVVVYYYGYLQNSVSKP